jgi:glycosyltransferase involved in cell wall biosynthesis
MKKTLCLNMIVKNEAKVIERCLLSLQNLIDYWVIADTGSSDGTQTLIQEMLKNIPGEFYERPWVDFAYNRNEILSFSQRKGDYILLIDADEWFEFLTKPFYLPALTKDCYAIIHRSEGIDFQRAVLLNNHLDWKWIGAIHEQPECTKKPSIGFIPNWVNICTQDGHRSQDPEKFLKDIEILENALAKDPQNTRHIFYLAETYSIVGEYLAAWKAYEKRVALGSPHLEVFWSLYQIGRMKELLKEPAESFIHTYCMAFQLRPSRAEPLFFLANYYLSTGCVYLTYLIAKSASMIPLPSDAHFVETWMYDWGILLQLAKSAWALGFKDEGKTAFQKILPIKTLPAQYRDEILSVLNESCD